VIVDGSHLLHRCRYRTPETDWKVYCALFFNLFLAVLRVLKDFDAIALWNVGGSYKKRVAPEFENGLVKQHYALASEWLRRKLPITGFRSLTAEGVETGEVAYWLVHDKLAQLNGVENYLVSADKNWRQIIADKWTLYDPLNGEAMSYVDFWKKYGSRAYCSRRAALLGNPQMPRCYGVDKYNVEKYVEKIAEGQDLMTRDVESVNVHEFVADGQLTRNLERLDLSGLCRGERRCLHLKYAECLKKVSRPSLTDWIETACEINAPALITYGQGL